MKRVGDNVCIKRKITKFKNRDTEQRNLLNNLAKNVK